MGSLLSEIEAVAAATAFSGVVRVDDGDREPQVRAFGFADRAHRIANTADTMFGIASGVKGLTALTVLSLVEEGRLDLQTPVRAVLDEDLPLIDPEVTVEHLLAHRSGIGDYFDEDTAGDVTDYVLAVPVHQLAATEQYLRVLGGQPTKFGPGKRFAYSNSGYVVLALIAERVGGAPFPDLVRQRVCGPAAMTDTAFLRSDELDGRAARGYLAAEGLRTNVLHLPVLGSGDGGIYSTAHDIRALWTAVFGGRIISPRWVAEMIRPRSDVPKETKRYGLGMWLHATGPAVMLEGYDAGVSFRTVHDPGRGLTHTVLSNTSDGAWPITRRLDELLTT